MGILEEVIKNGNPQEECDWNEQEIELIKIMVNGESMQGYLFRCLHCGKHFLYYDVD